MMMIMNTDDGFVVWEHIMLDCAMQSTFTCTCRLHVSQKKQDT